MVELRCHFSFRKINSRLLKFTLTAVAVTLCLCLANPAQSQDNIGIFWDSAFTQSYATPNSLPGILTGYLVIKDPTTTYGITGWECCVGIDGPAQFISWDLEGQAINVATAPCFSVGIGPTPVLVRDDIHLATFQIMVTESSPVALTVYPSDHASVPGQMSFIAYADPGTLHPMTTGTGQPEVAWLDEPSTQLVVDPPSLDFGDVFLDGRTVQTLSVTNIGMAPSYLNIYLPGGCGPFSMPGLSGAVTIPPGESITIHVAFEPETVGSQSCGLIMGGILPSVPMVGNGVLPDFRYTILPDFLEFAPTETGTTSERMVNIHNTGALPFTVTPSIPGTCPEFTITGGATPVQIDPGTSHSITIGFTPLVAGDYPCTLELGDLLPVVVLAGQGFDMVASWSPTSYDCGPVGVGLSEERSFYLANIGPVHLTIYPSIPDTARSFRLLSTAGLGLPPGSQARMDVAFEPKEPGPHHVALDLGFYGGTIELLGQGDPRPAEWTVTPEALDFGLIAIGFPLYKSVVISNTGGTFLDLDISLDDPDLGYALVSGGGIHQLVTGSSHEVVVYFDPQAEGVFETNLNLGALILPVPVTGAANIPSVVCEVDPVSLTFGPLDLGQSQTKTYSVTNSGTETLHITPSSNSPDFIIPTFDRTLERGQTAQFAVTFLAQTPGVHYGRIDLGVDACSDVSLVGTATSPSGSGNNTVGIFFDPLYTYFETYTTSANQIVEGYLVLKNPSETSGVGAWELAVDMDGPGLWLGWELEGQHINVGQGNEFIVGIGGSPLPAGPSVLLATCQILVAEPMSDPVTLSLSPIRVPSLPGQMVWAPWHDASMLMPLFPYTGQSMVAVINWGEIVGIDYPAPQVYVTGGSVELNWTLPDDAADGCHVYRRDAAGEVSRLTDQPLPVFGSSLTFTDRPAGYASGSILYYSYSVVIEGTEGPRSPESKVLLANLPTVMTRLLPNIPNPFNPMTEIHFELDRPQLAKVSIYDVTGRLIKVLADGNLAAGPHMRVWRGRDSGGRQVPSGAYYVRLVSERKHDHTKIMLLK